MRADATHRFEFEVDGGQRPRFVCLARTRAEAEQIAKHAGAPAGLVQRRPLGPDEGDARARRELADAGLVGAWAMAAAEVVAVLDTVRHRPGLAASIVSVSHLPLAEICVRGLRPCGCGRHESGPPGMHPVEAPAAVIVTLLEDGGWQLHLWVRDDWEFEPDDLDWARCEGPWCGATGVLDLSPGCSVWSIGGEVLDVLQAVADLRPAELSCVPVPVDELGHRSRGPVARVEPPTA